MLSLLLSLVQGWVAPPQLVASARCRSRVIQLAAARQHEDAIKDLLTEKAVQTVQTYWAAMRGNLYTEWLDKFHAARGGARVSAEGWARYMWAILNEERVEAVLQRAVMKESKEVTAFKQVHSLLFQRPAAPLDRD